jgi:hypothetical protein
MPPFDLGVLVGGSRHGSIVLTRGAGRALLRTQLSRWTRDEIIVRKPICSARLGALTPTGCQDADRRIRDDQRRPPTELGHRSLVRPGPSLFGRFGSLFG